MITALTHERYVLALDASKSLEERAAAIRLLEAEDPDADDIRPTWRTDSDQVIVDRFVHDMAMIGCGTPESYLAEFG